MKGKSGPTRERMDVLINELPGLHNNHRYFCISAGTVNYQEDGEPVLVPALSLFYKFTISHIYYKNMAQKRYIGQGSGKGTETPSLSRCATLPSSPHVHQPGSSLNSEL